MSFTASLAEIVRENRSGLLAAAPHWERVPLGSVAAILNGYPFPSDGFSATRGVPLLRIRDVGSRVTDARFDGEYDLAYLIEPGDFVVGMDGDFKSGLWTGPQAVLNQRVCKITPDEELLRRRFLAYVLPGYLDAINAHTSAITVKHLSSKTVAEIPIPLPCLCEQDRIVSAIEEQFTRLDAAVAALERARANLKRYRASVLKAATEGRLVPTEAEVARREGRDYEPAGVLLGRILRERRDRWEAEELARLTAKGKAPTDDRWKRKYKEPEAPDTSGLPELPEGWVWASLGQLFGVHVGATPSRAVPAYWDGDVPWVSSGEVAFCRIRRTRESITRLGLANASTEVHAPGTVLLGMIGEGKTRGQVAVLDIAACNNQNCAAIRVSETACSPDYVYRFLEGQYEATRRVGSGNNQPALNKRRVQEIAIPLPPAAEQVRIAEEAGRLLSGAERLASMQQTTLTRAARLRQSILKRAFEGRLVPQDPADEPASVLLERIRRERERERSDAGRAIFR